MTASDDIPTLKDELDRKSIETLEVLARQLEQGKITKAQFDIATWVLWSALAGLVSNEVCDAICEANAGADHYQKVHAPMKKGDALVVVVFSTEAKVSLLTGKDKREWDFADDLIPTAAARNKFKELVKQLREKGYVPA